MSLITRTYTFTDGTVAYGSQVDAEVANIVNTLNSLDQGNTTWTNVKLATLIPTQDLDFSSYRLKHVGTPTTSGDAAQYPITSTQLSAGVALANLGSSSIRGSTANSGGSAQEISQGTISTPDLRANAVTKIQQSNDTGSNAGPFTTAASVSITTLGFPVLILATLTAGNAAAAITVSAHVTRASTAFNGNSAQAATAGAGKDATASILTIDNPAAGTYTYNLNYVTSLTTLAHYSLQAIELRA